MREVIPILQLISLATIGVCVFVRLHVNVNNPVKLAQLQAQCPGEWKKAYWNGYLDGEPMSYHFFKNMTTNQVHDVKIVYEWWNQ